MIKERISEMLADAERIAPEKLQAKILENKEILLRNYSLIRLDDTGVLPFEIEELEYTSERIKTMDVLRKIELLP